MALPLLLGLGALTAGAYYLTRPKAKPVTASIVPAGYSYTPLPPPPPPPPPTYPEDEPHGPVAEEGGNNPE